MLCGLPFSGKTTVATALAHWLGINRVAIDDINDEREVWDDETGMSPEEWTKTYDEAYRRLGLALSQGKSALDDSTNFTKRLRDHLRALAERYNARTTVIYVDIPFSEARHRWQENRQTRVSADVRDSDFAYVVEQFEPPTEDENVFRYDGSISLEKWISLTFSDRVTHHASSHAQRIHD
jgi:predicted kinase